MNASKTTSISVGATFRAALLHHATQSPELAGTAGLARRIRFARQLSGLRQADIAKACGLTRSAVAFWEQPETCRPSAQQLVVLSDTLKVSLDWLLRGRLSEVDAKAAAAFGEVPIRFDLSQP